MPKRKILFADNSIDFINARKEFLENEGYEVIIATNPSDARKVLEQKGIDVAILDIRLLRDYDENDISGLILAKEVARHVPKILLTGYPSIESAIQALAPDLEGLPIAVKFLTKQKQELDGPEALLNAVSEALQFGKRVFQQVVDDITRQLNEDYVNARQEARIHYWVSITVSAIGIILIFGGILLGFQNTENFPLGLASTVSGIVTEVVNYLFFRRLDIAHERVDKYHSELLRMNFFESLLTLSDEMLSENNRENTKNKIINLAAKQWLISGSVKKLEGEK
ncbi:MAG: response regulator [Anaerolineales bacterium]|nr:response regulator [Anaerolineales bacterium]